MKLAIFIITNLILFLQIVAALTFFIGTIWIKFYFVFSDLKFYCIFKIISVACGSCSSINDCDNKSFETTQPYQNDKVSQIIKGIFGNMLVDLTINFTFFIFHIILWKKNSLQKIKNMNFIKIFLTIILLIVFIILVVLFFVRSEDYSYSFSSIELIKEETDWPYAIIVIPALMIISLIFNFLLFRNLKLLLNHKYINDIPAKRIFDNSEMKIIVQ